MCWINPMISHTKWMWLLLLLCRSNWSDYTDKNKAYCSEASPAEVCPRLHHSWCRLLLHRPLVPRPLPLSAETKFCSQVTSKAKPKQATSTPDPSWMMPQTIFCKPLNQCRLVLPQPLVPCPLKSDVQLSYPQLKMGSEQRRDGWRQQHGMENVTGLQSWEKKCFQVSPDSSLV